MALSNLWRINTWWIYNRDERCGLQPCYTCKWDYSQLSATKQTNQLRRKRSLLFHNKKLAHNFPNLSWPFSLSSATSALSAETLAQSTFISTAYFKAKDREGCQREEMSHQGNIKGVKREKRYEYRRVHHRSTVAWRFSRAGLLIQIQEAIKSARWEAAFE